MTTITKCPFQLHRNSSLGGIPRHQKFSYPIRRPSHYQQVQFWACAAALLRRRPFPLANRHPQKLTVHTRDRIPSVPVTIWCCNNYKNNPNQFWGKNEAVSKLWPPVKSNWKNVVAKLVFVLAEITTGMKMINVNDFDISRLKKIVWKNKNKRGRNVLGLTRFYKCAPSTKSKSMMSSDIPAMLSPCPTLGPIVLVTANSWAIRQGPVNLRHHLVTVSTQTGEKSKINIRKKEKNKKKEYNVNMKWVERGNNGNHWLEIQQRPSASIVQPFVWCLAPSVNSSGQNDFTLKGWRAEFSSPLHLVH